MTWKWLSNNSAETLKVTRVDQAFCLQINTALSSWSHSLKENAENGAVVLENCSGELGRAPPWSVS